jgi:hypothetical protein
MPATRSYLGPLVRPGSWSKRPGFLIEKVFDQELTEALNSTRILFEFLVEIPARKNLIGLIVPGRKNALKIDFLQSIPSNSNVHKGKVGYTR